MKYYKEEEIEKFAEEFADSVERRGCSFWQGLYRGYIKGFKEQQKNFKA